ncbi:hypothetical protein FF2_018735 [Malus domestica]
MGTASFWEKQIGIPDPNLRSSIGGQRSEQKKLFSGRSSCDLAFCWSSNCVHFYRKEYLLLLPAIQHFG